MTNPDEVTASWPDRRPVVLRGGTVLTMDDAHTVLVDADPYGYPLIKGEGKGKGTTRPEFSTLKSARSAQKVLRSGVTSISVPGGTWFTDVGVRDAIELGSWKARACLSPAA